MSIAKESGRLGWLAAALSTHKGRIMGLLGRISDLGNVHAMKPKIFSKFIYLMEQVACERDEEIRIMSTIDAIERKHRFSRKGGWLKRAEPLPEQMRYEHDGECEYGYDDDFKSKKANASAAGNDVDDIYYDGLGPVPQPQRSHTFFWLLVFWYLMTRRGNSPKKQSLTVD